MVEIFENGCHSYYCGGAKTPKTKVFENVDVMNWIISLPRRTKMYRFLIVENDSKTLVWTRIFVSIFVGSKTEAYENCQVGTLP